ncbi:GGDEF domain-containing protein [Sphingomonas sp. RT2P30]|uniref:GGDEF domain-containing protein n=1 Tax=Parasphingomonas halimpatiens TaxID=3096162 RepID=UPI002FC9967C
MHQSFESTRVAQAVAGRGARGFTPGAAIIEAGARAGQSQSLFDEIGTFLFSNELDLTALNLMCAHDYLSRSNRKLVLAIEEALASRTPLSNAWVETFYAACPVTERRAASIASTTEQVEVVLTQCVELVERSRGSAHVYSNALQAEAEELTSAEALPAVERLIGLTQAMLDQTRDIQEELRQRAIETTQLRTTLQSAQREAHVDHLTGLPNRRDFDARLRTVAETAAREGRPAVVALCDIDHFKAVNDAHGHDTGDRVLILVASSLKKAAGDTFYVARHGGEEFALIFEDCTVAAAVAIVDDLRGALAARRLINQATHQPIGHVTFSAGIAELDPLDGGTVALKRADKALYAAKQGGRNRVLVAEPKI